MPNHPPTPVLNVLGASLPSDVECTALKIEHGIESRQHCKGASASSGMESHHILQDKAMVGLISKYSGWAVLLDASSGGFHDQINAKQIARNCGPNPPATFGDLVKSSRDDLKDTFKANGKDETTAQKLADCLTIEAVNKTQEKRKSKGEKPLTPTSPVAKVKGCFAGDTPIWMADGSRLAAATLEVGMMVAGGHVVRRTSGCTSAVITLVTERDVLRLAPTHRLRLASGEAVRADRVREGDLLSTSCGTVQVREVMRPARAELVYTFDFDMVIDVPVGADGMLAEMPALGAPHRATMRLSRGTHHAAA